MRHLIVIIALAALFSATIDTQPADAGGQRNGASPPPAPRVTVPPAPRPAPAHPGPPKHVPHVVTPSLAVRFPPLPSVPPRGLTLQFSGRLPGQFHTRLPGRGPFSHDGRFGSAYYPFFPPFAPVAISAGDPAVGAPSVPAVATGWLRLSATPAAGRVFIDSYYVGTVADIEAQGGLAVDAGPHRIEILSPQHQSLTEDLRVLPQETVTFRAALELMRPVVQAAPAAPPGPMYVIPNCYLGNVPPRPNRLPSGCDIAKVEVLGPK